MQVLCVCVCVREGECEGAEILRSQSERAGKRPLCSLWKSNLQSKENWRENLTSSEVIGPKTLSFSIGTDGRSPALQFAVILSVSVCRRPHES